MKTDSFQTQRSLSRRALLLAALSFAISSPAGTPKLTGISRDYIQRGTPAEVTLTGESLGGANRIVVSGAPGLTAEVVVAGPLPVTVESSSEGVATLAPPNDKSLTIKLSSAPDAPLVERELRVVTPEGVSNPLPLRLSPLPEVASARDNNSIASAQAVTLPAIINGAITSGRDSDFFRVKAKKGEHLIFDVHAFRLGSPLDSSLTVLDTSGKELARNEDAAGLDSTLDFAVPEDGEYIVQLRDFRYQGGGNYKYRLVAGNLPFVKSAFPFGGRRGETVELALAGSNLAGAEKILLRLSPDAEPGKQEIRAATPRGLSNPFPFDVSDLPQVIETEPNSALDQADAIPIPAAVNGRIDKDGDYDAFRFTAQKDQRIVFDVHAFRYGSPLDALLTLTDDRGNILLRSDDERGYGSDSRLDYKFSADGQYFILIEDLIGRGGPEYAYRLTASTPQPDFSVAFLPDTPRLRANGRVPIRCEVSRQNSFSQPVKIICEDLPPGVFAEPLYLDPSGPGSGYLVLHANHTANPGSFPLKLVAIAESDGSVLQREATPISGDKPVKAAFITLLDPAPFTVQALTPLASIEQNQSGKIEILVDRTAGFFGPITVTAEGFSAGRDPITRSFDLQPVTIPPGQNRGSLALKTRLDSEIGARPIFLKAEGSLNGSVVSSYSTLIPVATTQIPFLLNTSLKKLVVTALPSNSGSAAGEGTFVVKAERRAGFAAEIELKLEGLPEGVTATIPKIAANENEATIKLAASENAKPGDYKISITGTGLHNDRNYRFQPGEITLTVNAPEPAETKVANSAQ